MSHLYYCRRCDKVFSYPKEYTDMRCPTCNRPSKYVKREEVEVKPVKPTETPKKTTRKRRTKKK